MPSGTFSSSSYDLLRLIDDVGIVGYWRWSFIDGAHFWSPGLYRIIGISADLVGPDYSLLFRMIHPDDCPPPMDPDLIRQGGAVPPATFRILRPDTSIRTVRSRVDVRTSPSGRPLSAHGVIVDISDSEVLARAAAERQRRDRAIFDSVGAFTSTTDVYPFRKFSPQWLDLVGLPEKELLQEPTLPILKDERRHWRDHGREQYLTKRLVNTMPRLRLANGETVTYRMVMIPMLNEAGDVESWTNFVCPIQLKIKPTGRLLLGLERRIEAEHIRAGRALLDWSMADLSRASGVSLSTIRRLEGSDVTVSVANHNQVVAALRHAGIVFSLLEGTGIAVGKRA